MTTPEGRVKTKLKRRLKEFGTQVYQFWPVQTGRGKRTLDVLICVHGFFLAVETKAPGKVPTAIQKITIEEIRTAGGRVLVVEDDYGIDMVYKLCRILIERNRRYTPPASD